MTHFKLLLYMMYVEVHYCLVYNVQLFQHLLTLFSSLNYLCAFEKN